MACGRITISSRLGGLPEIIRHGENGFLVDPGDYERFAMTLKDVLDHVDEMGYVEHNARETIVARHSPESVGARVTRVYRSIDE
jgi:glycosyltransferase involved in cell wall biosynthesis